MTCLTDDELRGDSLETRAHLAACSSCRLRLETLLRREATTREAGAPPVAPKATELIEGTQVGRYRVISVVGEGGMGTVYRAFDPELNRTIALKILHVRIAEARPTEARARMVREAQAQAQLNHPNVVAIYDVGTHDESVYLALELVEGVTLREWLRQGERGWREIVQVFLAAASGLVAAHDAGLVHRDFKPNNVLIGKDGRVRVLDFGLARATTQREEPSTATPDLAATLPELGTPPSLSKPLTAEGMIAGTAGYIAPEVLRGEASDARGDQFAFGVALFEALFGRRPWRGRGGEPVTPLLGGGRKPEIPPDTRVPASVQTAVLKALELEPGQRYPSLRELSRALAGDTAVPRSRVPAIGAATLALALSGIGVAAWLTSRPDCSAEGRRLDGAWNPEVRSRVAASFSATGRPAAADTFARVSHTLDEWSNEWALEATNACIADAKADGQRREAELLRRVCLERRLGELKALTDVFQSADPGIVDQATSAAKLLLAPQRCREPKLVTGMGPPLADPRARSTADLLHARLDRANAQLVSGQFPLAMKAADEVAKEAHEQGQQLLEAEALNLLTKIQGRSFLLAEAAKTAERALEVARATGADIEIFTAAVRAAYVANLTRKPDDAARAIAIAEEARARLGDDELLEANLLEARAGSLSLSQRDGEALKLLQRALELKTRRLGADHPDSIVSLLNIGKTYGELGAARESCDAASRALTLSEQALGKDHPALIVGRCNLCFAYSGEGRFAEGAALCEAGAALAARIHGGKNPMSAWCLGNLASVYSAAGDGSAAVDAGNRAVAIADVLFKPDSLQRAEAHLYRARAYLTAGKLEPARADIDAALGPAEKEIGKDDPDFSEYLDVKGQLELASGHAEQALPFLERAAELRNDHYGQSERAETHLMLGAALWDSGGDRVRAHALVTKAQAELADLPTQTALRGRVEKWLGSHPAPK